MHAGVFSLILFHEEFAKRCASISMFKSFTSIFKREKRKIKPGTQLLQNGPSLWVLIAVRLFRVTLGQPIIGGTACEGTACSGEEPSLEPWLPLLTSILPLYFTAGQFQLSFLCLLDLLLSSIRFEWYYLLFFLSVGLYFCFGHQYRS